MAIKPVETGGHLPIVRSGVVLVHPLERLHCSVFDADQRPVKVLERIQTPYFLGTSELPGGWGRKGGRAPTTATSISIRKNHLVTVSSGGCRIRSPRRALWPLGGTRSARRNACESFERIPCSNKRPADADGPRRTTKSAESGCCVGFASCMRRKLQRWRRHP